MKLILREDVENLGKGGELVDVKPGYGRNFLLPRGLAVVANPRNVRELEHQKAVAQAEKRYGRVFQVGTFGRFGQGGDKGAILTRKIMTSGLVKNSEAVHILRGGFKV